MVSEYKINDITVYKYVMPLIESNMYLMLMGEDALVIDPHKEEEADRLLDSYGVKRITIILTHEHYDHIFGVNYFRTKWDCKVYGNQKCGERVMNPEANLSAYFTEMFITKSKEEQDLAKQLFTEKFSCEIDVGFKGAMELEIGGLQVRMLETPGHSPGGICILVDSNYIFTGDSLVGGNKVITRLPGGSKKEYNEITKPFLEALPEDMIIFPGHGEEGKRKDFRIA